MNYSRVYDALVASSDNSAYIERHHIVPRCVGGSDDAANIVRITPRKHFLAHWLLIKIYKNSEHCRKLQYAFTCMRRGRKLSAWQYERLKIAYSDASRGKPGSRLGAKWNFETRKKQEAWRANNPSPLLGKPSKKKGRKVSAKVLAKMVAANRKIAKNLVGSYIRKSALTKDEIVSKLSVNVCTGRIQFKDYTISRGYKQAGTRKSGNHARVIGLYGEKWSAAYIIWVSAYNNEPDGYLDYIDGDKTNESIFNLYEIKITDVQEL